MGHVPIYVRTCTTHFSQQIGITTHPHIVTTRLTYLGAYGHLLQQPIPPGAPQGRPAARPGTEASGRGLADSKTQAERIGS